MRQGCHNFPSPLLTAEQSTVALTQHSILLTVQGMKPGGHCMPDNPLSFVPEELNLREVWWLKDTQPAGASMDPMCPPSWSLSLSLSQEYY